MTRGSLAPGVPGATIRRRRTRSLIYAGPVPELPEVEIAVRRIDRTLKGAEVESALSPGMVALKSVKPPLDAIVGTSVHGVRRVGKMPVVEFGHGGEAELALLVHMMSAGRLQVFDERASLRDRRSRVLVRFGDGRELRLREFGTKQRAWAKLMAAGDVAGDEMVATLGPEAWPAPALESLRRDRRSVPPPALAAPRPADDRRHRPQLGRRDPLGGEALPVQEGRRARSG